MRAATLEDVGTAVAKDDAPNYSSFSRLSTTSLATRHLGLVFCEDLVEQNAKHQNRAQPSDRLDLVPKHNCRQANAKHLSRRHDDGKYNRAKLKNVA